MIAVFIPLAVGYLLGNEQARQKVESSLKSALAAGMTNLNKKRAPTVVPSQAMVAPIVEETQEVINVNPTPPPAPTLTTFTPYPKAIV